ncbi:unnamed protein product [Angiostrongylus costaricensis]|uniref:Uncharacterized protein n=1 Tax=Angiostrongylus costaricensis TaxID=334426 RepID=A0A0R3PLV5_ANGCS|nr:unnamed protein product [Angiostrongylus costaricensis]
MFSDFNIINLQDDGVLKERKSEFNVVLEAMVLQQLEDEAESNGIARNLFDLIDFIGKDWIPEFYKRHRFVAMNV